MSGIAEVIVPVPHLLAVARLPEALAVGSLTVERTGGSGAVEVVGSLRGHVAAARWRSGRRHGTAGYEVVRTHDDRCALTVVLDGLDCATARQVADAARRALVESVTAVAAPAVAATVERAARPVTRPA